VQQTAGTTHGRRVLGNQVIGQVVIKIRQQHGVKLESKPANYTCDRSTGTDLFGLAQNLSLIKGSSKKL
jgi:hypothetical protein